MKALIDDFLVFFFIKINIIFNINCLNISPFIMMDILILVTNTMYFGLIIQSCNGNVTKNYI